MENPKNLKRILWASFLVLDINLHKTSRLEVLKNLARKGHNVNLLAVRSGDASQIDDSELNMILVPLRYFPIISSVMFAVFMFFFLVILQSRNTALRWTHAPQEKANDFAELALLQHF